MTGDIHGDPIRLWSIENFCNNHKTTIDDWLICLGDVGLNYYGAKSKKEIAIKNEVAKLPIKMFCIHGNHERGRVKRMDILKQSYAENTRFVVMCYGIQIIQISSLLSMVKSM